jgi:hypothetical protein
MGRGREALIYYVRGEINNANLTALGLPFCARLSVAHLEGESAQVLFTWLTLLKFQKIEARNESNSEAVK